MGTVEHRVLPQKSKGKNVSPIVPLTALKNQKASRGRGSACAAGGCIGVENLGVPNPRRTGTGAIRWELLINSHLSAPQAQCVWHFACPVLRGFGALRFSHIAADARRTHRPPAPVRFRPPIPLYRIFSLISLLLLSICVRIVAEIVSPSKPKGNPKTGLEGNRTALILQDGVTRP